MNEVFPPCPRCGGPLTVRGGSVLTSEPPIYGVICEKCGATGSSEPLRTVAKPTTPDDRPTLET